MSPFRSLSSIMLCNRRCHGDGFFAKKQTDSANYIDPGYCLHHQGFYRTEVVAIELVRDESGVALDSAFFAIFISFRADGRSQNPSL